jgi:hypothetical protein
LGPTCHPLPQAVSHRTPPPPPESDRCTHPHVWSTRQGSSLGYLSRAPPLEFPHPSRPRPPVRRPQTLAAAAVESSPSSSFRRREAARELRLEVSNPLVPFVEDLVHCGTLSDLAGDRTHTAASTGRFAASPPRPPPLPASPLRAPRVGALRASN